MRLRLHFMLCAFILSTFRGGSWNFFFLSLLLLPFLFPKLFFFFLSSPVQTPLPLPPGPLAITDWDTLSSDWCSQCNLKCMR